MHNLNELDTQSATLAVEFNQTDLTRFGGLPFFVNKYIRASGMAARISVVLSFAPQKLCCGAKLLAVSYIANVNVPTDFSSGRYFS